MKKNKTDLNAAAHLLKVVNTALTPEFIADCQREMEERNRASENERALREKLDKWRCNYCGQDGLRHAELVAHMRSAGYIMSENPVKGLKAAMDSLRASASMCGPVREWLLNGMERWFKLKGSNSLDMLLGLKKNDGGVSLALKKSKREDETEIMYFRIALMIGEAKKSGTRLNVSQAIARLRTEEHEGINWDDIKRGYPSWNVHGDKIEKSERWRKKQFREMIENYPEACKQILIDREWLEKNPGREGELARKYLRRTNVRHFKVF